jgi:hypothetical protein
MLSLAQSAAAMFQKAQTFFVMRKREEKRILFFVLEAILWVEQGEG